MSHTPTKPTISPSKRHFIIENLIWLIPLATLGITVLTLYQTFIESRINVTLILETGEGITPGKTKVMLSGFEIGQVKNIELNATLNSATATLEIDRSAENALREHSQFWVARPVISLSEFKNLDTLVKGSHINLLPKGGAPTREFIALSTPPPENDIHKGLTLVFESNRPVSLALNSPILYRNIQIGKITQIELPEEGTITRLIGHIEPTYRRLVHPKSRFRHLEGIRIKGGLDGIDIKVGSLESLLKGGIELYNPTGASSSGQVVDSTYFNLESSDAHLQAHRILVRFSDVSGMSEGNTSLTWKGLEVGYVEKIKPIFHKGQFEVTFVTEAFARSIFRKGSKFWKVSPKVDLSGVSGLDTLIKGSRIEIKVGSGKETNQFVSLDAPPKEPDKRGIAFNLHATSSKGLSIGAPILWKGFSIGEITDIQPTPQKIQVEAFVYEPYISLVKTNARFWNASGIKVNASLQQGLDVDVESLKSIAIGGITFGYESQQQGKVIQANQSFTLFSNESEALGAHGFITVITQELKGIKEGSPVKYKGIKVGKVHAISLLPSSAISLTLQYPKSLQYLYGEGVQIWADPFELSLKGVNNPEALLLGTPLQLSPGMGPLVSEVSLSSSRPSQYGDPLLVTIFAPVSDGITKGQPVLYRNIQIGTVVDVHLDKNAQSVLTKVEIDPEFSPLIRDNSKFWSMSGLDINYGLFSGLQVRTNTLSTLIQGGLAVSTPTAPGKRVESGHQFPRHDKPQAEWLKWEPVIKLGLPQNDADSP